MIAKPRTNQAALDWVLLTVFFAIVVVGWLMLYTASYNGDGGLWFSFESTIGRQTIWIGVAMVCFLVFISLDWRLWSSLAYPIFICTTISLVAVLIFGKEVKGATSWFNVFGYSVQPSEFAKLGTALGLSAYLGQTNIDINEFGKTLVAFAIFLIPAFLIFLQPDAGTAIIFISFMVPMYRAGLNPILYILAISLGFIFIGSLLWDPFLMLIIILLVAYMVWAYNSKDNRLPLSLFLLLCLFSIASYNFIDYRIILITVLLCGFYFGFLVYREARYKLLSVNAILCVGASILSFGTSWGFENILKSHQKERINVWLRPELSDPHGALYNIIQSKTAIGSGGFTGKGFLDGNMTRLNYVPEQATDFIFSIMGEEQGFIGSASLILLMTFLLYRLTLMAERATLPFVRYFAYSIAGILFFHFFINIGMTMGIMPVIGIPLPLMSKGGSSMVTFFIMISILLKMDQAGRRV